MVHDKTGLNIPTCKNSSLAVSGREMRRSDNLLLHSSDGRTKPFFTMWAAVGSSVLEALCPAADSLLL